MENSNSKNSLSFSGCGFLGIYHVGVASCIKEYAPHLYENKIIGASAGALVSSALLSGCCLGECTTFVLKLSMDARSRTLGPLSPRFALVSNLRKALEIFLPDDAHTRVSGKLYISLTRVSDNKNVLASDFRSKEDLIDCLICSSFVPFYSGIFPPKFKGVHYIDGGITDNLPIFDDQTITVSPFAGESDICPDDSSYCPHHITLAGLNMQITSNNIYRASVAFFPPPPEVLSDMCRRGFADALRFLKTNKLISCKKHISVHSALFSLKPLDDQHILNDCIQTDNHHLLCQKETPTIAPIAINSNDNVSFGLYNDSFEYDDSLVNHNDNEYDDNDDNENTECNECIKIGYEAIKDLPPMAVQQALQAALDEDRNGYLSNLYKCKAFHVTSLMVVPYTFPFEVSLMITRKFVGWVPNLYKDACWFFNGLYNLSKNFLHLKHDDQSASELTTWLFSFGQFLGMLRRNNLKSASRKRSFIEKDFQLENNFDLKTQSTILLKDFQLRKMGVVRLKKKNLNSVCIQKDNLNSVCIQKEEDVNVETIIYHRDNDLLNFDSFKHNNLKTNEIEKLYNVDVDSFEYAVELTEEMEAILSYYYLDSKNNIKIVEIFPPK